MEGPHHSLQMSVEANALLDNPDPLDHRLQTDVMRTMIRRILTMFSRTRELPVAIANTKRALRTYSTIAIGIRATSNDLRWVSAGTRRHLGLRLRHTDCTIFPTESTLARLTRLARNGDQMLKQSRCVNALVPRSSDL
jgi:hypothetical protein